MNINSLTLSGRLTRDSELRSTASGMAVLGFTLAFNDSRKVNGEWQDVPNYISCTMFGKRAEALSNKLTKGLKVCIHGKLRFSSWETNEGQKRNQLTAIVDDLDFVEPKKDAVKWNDERLDEVLPWAKQASKPVQNSSKVNKKTPNSSDDLPF